MQVELAFTSGDDGPLEFCGEPPRVFAFPRGFCYNFHCEKIIAKNKIRPDIA